MGRYLDDLADVLRAAGLTVVELDGWATRGRSGNSQFADGRPWCVMWHHAASAGDGAWDADYCTYSAPDAPLTNLVIGRDGIVYVCAGGPTNTNGKGDPLTFSKGTVPADSMNTYAIGIEISNDGVGMTYPTVQVDACITASLAMGNAYGLEPGDAAGHAHYAESRKIDPATAAAVDGPWQPDPINTSGTWELEDLRDELIQRAYRTPTPTPPTPTPDEDPLMLKLILKDVRNGAIYLCDTASKTWVRDWDAWIQLEFRIAESAGGTRPSPWDGITYRMFEHAGDDVIASYGPIIGDRPVDVDAYGRM